MNRAVDQWLKQVRDWVKQQLDMPQVDGQESKIGREGAHAFNALESWLREGFAPPTDWLVEVKNKCSDEWDAIRQALRDRKDAIDNLTATQERCSALMLENQQLKQRMRVLDVETEGMLDAVRQSRKEEIDMLKHQLACSRRLDLAANVISFFIVAGQDLPGRPVVPEQNQVRFRMRLVTEEFKEMYKAVFNSPAAIPWKFERLCRDLDEYVEVADVQVDMPDFVDAVADLEYVTEGAAVAFGVDMRPIHQAVHETNMQKAGGPRREDGKLQKPEGWKPPDFVQLLRNQGWKDP